MELMLSLVDADIPVSKISDAAAATIPNRLTHRSVSSILCSLGRILTELFRCNDEPIDAVNNVG